MAISQRVFVAKKIELRIVLADEGQKFPEYYRVIENMEFADEDDCVNTLTMIFNQVLCSSPVVIQIKSEIEEKREDNTMETVKLDPQLVTAIVDELVKLPNVRYDR